MSLLGLPEAKIPPAVLGVVSRLRSLGFQSFLVGGCVRDLVLGLTPKDYDVATDATPDQVEGAFRRVVPTGKQHGTVTVLTDSLSVEVTTFRSEGTYLDARRPSEVKFHGSIEDDLSRRDFTINAMAFDPLANDLRDPFGGQRDLAAKVIRGVGEPVERFLEDGLRPLRAVRFATVLDFELEQRTAEAIPRAMESFRKVAAERVREEFCKLLLSSHPARGLKLLQTTGLLRTFLPELLEGVGQLQSEEYTSDVFEHAVATVEATPPELELRLAALLHDVAKPRVARRRSDGAFDFPGHEILGESMSTEVLERLKSPRKTIEAVANLVRHHLVGSLQPASDAELRRFAAKVGAANVEAHLLLAEANRIGKGKAADAELERLRMLEARIRAVLARRPALTVQSLALDGNEIMQILGVGPSPLVGEATRFLLGRVLDDPALNSAPALSELLREWVRAKGR
jgi:tRNA nucleotidyltransferase (CCA-adding enzyme)